MGISNFRSLQLDIGCLFLDRKKSALSYETMITKKEVAMKYRLRFVVFLNCLFLANCATVHLSKIEMDSMEVKSSVEKIERINNQLFLDVSDKVSGTKYWPQVTHTDWQAAYLVEETITKTPAILYEWNKYSNIESIKYKWNPAGLLALFYFGNPLWVDVKIKMKNGTKIFWTHKDRNFNIKNNFFIWLFYPRTIYSEAINVAKAYEHMRVLNLTTDSTNK